MHKAVFIGMGSASLLAAGMALAQGPLPPPSAAAHAPAAFETLVRQCREAFEARPMTEVAYAASRDAWVKRAYAPAEILANVRATPSPVTPYVAQITVIELASAQPGADFDTTRMLDVPMDRNLLRTERRMNYAFQEGQWTLLGMAVQLQVKADPSVDFETVRAVNLERKAARQLDGPIASCTLPPL